MNLLLAGAVYFILTYLAGFVFGSLREAFVVPRLGQLAATLIETPVMLAVTYWAATWVTSHFGSPHSPADRLWIGAIGFALLMSAEVIFSGVLRGLTVSQWFEHFKTADGAISLALFVLFAFMPWLVGR
jgi:hypothetical protein